jgi:hypothetical protein
MRAAKPRDRCLPCVGASDESLEPVRHGAAIAKRKSAMYEVGGIVLLHRRFARKGARRPAAQSSLAGGAHKHLGRCPEPRSKDVARAARAVWRNSNHIRPPPYAW